MDVIKTCYTCGGDGELDYGEAGIRTCYSCHGTGASDEGTIANGSKTLDERLTDIEDKINGIITKCDDIFEKVSE